jgi:DNA-binding PadR family transcriptional regulator
MVGCDVVWFVNGLEFRSSGMPCQCPIEHLFDITRKIAYHIRNGYVRNGYVSMAENKQSPEDLLPLTPAVFHILLALADGEKHGYVIMQEVEAVSDGSVNMGPGTLYGSIKRMLKAGLIIESDERPDPDMDHQQRRYYKLSGFGEHVLRAEAARLEAVVRAARLKNILGESS